MTLRLQSLVCRRDGRKLFEPVSLAAQTGDCIELLGPNGAGKTTLLRTLAGIHSQFDGAYESGEFLYQGHRIGLDGLLTPLENLQWFAALRGAHADMEALRQVLNRVGMTDSAMRPVHVLSQGQQRRVAMARWLLSGAQVWLLDEPYTSLDVDGQMLLNEVIGEHCADGGVAFCATHTPLTLLRRRQLNLTPLERAA